MNGVVVDMVCLAIGATLIGVETGSLLWGLAAWTIGYALWRPHSWIP